jgi:hypothetical protein
MAEAFTQEFKVRCSPLLKQLIDTACTRQELLASEYTRRALVAALKRDGLSLYDHYQPEQYALVSGEEVRQLTHADRPSDRDGVDGEWLPVVNMDETPFDPALHYRRKPYLKRDGDRVLRVWPIIAKAAYDHESELAAG